MEVGRSHEEVATDRYSTVSQGTPVGKRLPNTPPPGRSDNILCVRLGYSEKHVSGNAYTDIDQKGKM